MSPLKTSTPNNGNDKTTTNKIYIPKFSCFNANSPKAMSHAMNLLIVIGSSTNEPNNNITSVDTSKAAT